MTRVKRLDIYQTMLDSGLVPLFYHSDIDVARKTATAIANGGASVLEFTNRGEKALQVFSALNEYLAAENIPLILGVGSIADAPTAALFIAHGAQFVVAPMFNAEVAELCNRRKIAYIPGCATVTEISHAESFGVEIIKAFPGATVGGPKFIQSVLAPMPWSLIMPTGGVDATRENLAGWFGAGACAVGMGSKLVRKDWLQAGNYEAIEKSVRDVLKIIEEVRPK